MITRQIQGDIEFGSHTVDTLYCEMHFSVIGTDVCSADTCIFTETISHDWLSDTWQNLTNIGIINATPRHAPERQLLEKLHERTFELFEAMLISIHMILVDIGDDRHDRC